MRKLATTLALSTALFAAGSALGALPIGGNFTGTTSAHSMNGFKDLVTFVSAGGGRTLKQFQFGTLGCLGTGLFPVGTDPYAQAFTLGTVPKLAVSATGTIKTTTKAQFAETDNVVTSVTIQGAFAGSRSLSGTIVVSQTENGSTCKANPMKFSAVPGTPASLGYEDLKRGDPLDPSLEAAEPQLGSIRWPHSSGARRTMRRGIVLLASLASLALAGCGGRAPSVGDCLNASGFLVQERANVVRGSSPGGVNFTLTFYTHTGAARRAFAAIDPASAALLGDAVVEFAGNPPASPGAAPGKLSHGALATLRRCLAHP